MIRIARRCKRWNGNYDLMVNNKIVGMIFPTDYEVFEKAIDTLQQERGRNKKMGEQKHECKCNAMNKQFEDLLRECAESPEDLISIAIGLEPQARTAVTEVTELNKTIKRIMGKQEKKVEVEIEVVERGWAGHFCLSDRCLFRRNTLISKGKDRLIVSTVGNCIERALSTNMIALTGATIPKNEAVYETKCFIAENRHGYIDSNVTQEIYLEDTKVYIYRWEEQKAPLNIDNLANNMHENFVTKIVNLLKTTELKDW